jgi:serine/threonine protein kinase
MGVGRKRLPAKGNFKDEVRNLTTLNSGLSRNPRIVQYLAVFTVEDEQDEEAPKEFNIIFPLADADLELFLYNKEFGSAWDKTVEVIKEASNLVGAIRWLHEGLIISESGKVLVCCHMDLKPDNILVYLNRNHPVGWWKISDFGISSLKEREREIEPERAPRQRPTSTLLTAPTASPAESLRIITAEIKTSIKRPAGPFSAPEVEEGGVVGPESDIWSFGCILFQVLARAACGLAGLVELDDKRGSFKNGSQNDHFCQRIQGNKTLHEDVGAWLSDWNSLRSGEFPVRTMVMNCKFLIQKVLAMSPRARPTAVQLHKELAEIARGSGQTYLFDQDQNMVPQPPTGTIMQAPGPRIHITSLPPSTLPVSMSASRVNMPISPPVSPQPVSNTLDGHAQPFQRTSQPLPTPPLAMHEQVPPRPIQAGHEPPNLNQAPPHRPTGAPPPRLVRPEPELNLNSIQAQNAQYLASPPPPPPLPPPPPPPPPPPQRSSMTSPRQRSRHDSAHTSHSSVQGGEAHRSAKDETVNLNPPPGVISTLLSSTRAKILFIAPTEAVARALYGHSGEKVIHPPEKCTWVKGSLAGDYVALCSTSKSHNKVCSFNLPA